MNILFLSLIDFESIDEHNIYTDLLREFWKNGHSLYVISPVEQRSGKKSYKLTTDKAIIIKPLIHDMQKVSYFKKAYSMLTIESILIRTIKKELSTVKFDLVLYATPPISFQKVVDFVKNRDGALTYLLQKDIFPEGLLDLQVLSTTGVKGLIYKYYRNKEIKLLKSSDYIGCMSEANIEYIRTHNPFLDPKRVELCPNSIEPVDKSVDPEARNLLRRKYSIPINKKVFVYGGNLGKPQGITFLIECLKLCSDMTDVFFLIVGDGTEYNLLEKYANDSNQANLKLMRKLPKDDYDNLVGACDIGMIFLDYRFTIPNFPSRLLSYLQSKLPVLVVADPYSDIGKVVVDGDYGWYCESNSVNSFRSVVKEIIETDTSKMRENSYKYLLDNYDVKDACLTIVNSCYGSRKT